MKSLKHIIFEKLRINKNTHIQLKDEFVEAMKEIPIEKWKWSPPGMAKYNEMKENIRNFAFQEFKGNKNYMEEIYKQTYKYYLMTNGWSEEKIEDSYNNAIKTLDKIGWAQFSWSNLEQGWWHFVNWCIEQIKNK